MADQVTTATMPAIQIALPTPQVVVPQVQAEPPAPVSNYIETVATSAPARQEFACKALVQQDQLPQLRQYAKQVYRQMLTDPTLQMSYGKEALADLNALVDRLLKEVEPIRIPQLNGMMKDLNVKMNAIKGKYDLDDTKFRKDYEESLKGVKKLWRKAKDYVGMMKADILDIQTQLEKLEKDLTARQYDMTRNVAYYSQLYAENEASIQKLIQVIAIMELIVEEAQADANAITVGDASMGDRGDEQRQIRADLIDNMKIKVGDYKGRLFVAWATSPQTRMMRKLDIGMAAKLSTLVQSTIPTMKETLLKWRMQLQTFENAQIAGAITAMNNQWLTEFFAEGARVMPQIEAAIQEPTIWPDTMRSITDSLSQAAEGVLAAFEAGEQRRAEVDRAMLESSEVLKNVNRKVDDAVIGRITTSAVQPVPEMLALPPGRS